jgi:hypothetical protein
VVTGSESIRGTREDSGHVMVASRVTREMPEAWPVRLVVADGEETLVVPKEELTRRAHVASC